MKKLLEHYFQLSDPHFKGAVEVPGDILRFLAIASNGSFLQRILHQPLYSRFVTQVLVNNPLFETFDEKIQQLFTAGLIDFYDRDYQEFIKPERYQHLHYNGPKVLTLEHLHAGFVVCCVSLSFAICAFVFEWIVTLLQYLIIKHVLKVFYHLKDLEQQQHFLSSIENIVREQEEGIESLVSDDDIDIMYEEDLD